MRRSLLGDSNLSHHFVNALWPGEKDGVVARRVGAVAADGEGGIDGKPFLSRGARLIESAEPRQGGRVVEMRGLEIAVDLDCAAQLRNRFLVFAEKDLRDACEGLPMLSGGIAGTEPQRILDVGLGILSSPEKSLRQTDPRVSGGEIPVDGQRAIEFGNALRGPICIHVDDSQTQVSQHPFGRD